MIDNVHNRLSSHGIRLTNRPFWRGIVMAYVQPQTRSNRAAILTGVALLHGAVGYLLVTGLAVSWVEQVTGVVAARNIPITPPEPIPSPPPVDKTVAPADTPPLAPVPRLDLNRTPADLEVTTVPLPYEPLPAPRETLGPSPLPSATPLFTPKAAAPLGRPGQWVTSDDYPAVALRQEREGVTRFRVTVTAEGLVAGCEIVASSGSPDLDAATCRQISRKARFAAASDNQGARVAGSWTSSVKWVIPR